MASTTSIGTCELCGVTNRKTAMTRHVIACAAEHDPVGPAGPLVQVRIEAAGAPDYWLHIEARGDAPLQQLDASLRAVWLECCGHMSAFRVGRREVSKRTSLGSLAGGGMFDYEYDFGSTTALRGKLLGFRQGTAIRPAVRVLARNAPLTWRCAECTAGAVLLCPNCIDSDSWLFCSRHASGHPCAAEDMWMPVVNSPRMGVCGYVGPRSRRRRLPRREATPHAARESNLS
jgi:hypothetical protein